MDIFGTTVTVLQEIYNITVFIKGIIDDVKSYDSDTDDIRRKLKHEFVFVDTFKSMFFEDPTSSEVYKKHSLMLQEDVQSILQSLKRVLAEYGIEARKHGIFDTASDDKGIAGKVADGSQTEVHHRMSEFIKEIRSRAKDLKLKAFDWSLFEKKHIIKMLEAYSEWTTRLRQNMTLMVQMMLLKGLISGDFAQSQQAKDLGLQDVVTRQIHAQSVPDSSFTSLDALIVEGSERRITAGVTVARMEAPWLSEAKEFVIEQRIYENALQQAIDSKDETKVKELKSDLKNLAWLLHKSHSTEETDDTEVVAAKVPVLLTLRCLGYIDQPQKGQMQFVYEPPKMGPLDRKLSITTLHSLIMGTETQKFSYEPDFLGLWQNSWSGSKRNTVSMPKPSLRNRFFLAQALALTVLNIHNSGWVHKNLWSHGIIIVPSTDRSSRNGSPWLVPYVAGWEIARSSSTTATEMRPDYSIESNLYRHPARQQRPTMKYVFLHDIYSLGVLLMEIGLWNTAINVFHNGIEWAVRRRTAPSVNLVRTTWANVLKTSVQREMGDVYAEAVNCCLMGTFDVESHGAVETDLAIRFTKLVVDAIRPGLNV